MSTEPATKPVITKDQLDGTTNTLLLVALNTCEQNHIEIDRDILQLLIMSSLVKLVSYDETREIFAPYITFEE